jgi:hypothetical protein
MHRRYWSLSSELRHLLAHSAIFHAHLVIFLTHSAQLGHQVSNAKVALGASTLVNPLGMNTHCFSEGLHPRRL